jgi:hypothetical protein
MDYRKVETVLRWKRSDGSWHEFPFNAEARYKAGWYHVYLIGDLDKWNNSSAYSHYWILHDDKFAITEEQLTQLENGKEIIIEKGSGDKFYVRPKSEADQPRQPWWSSWWEYVTNSRERPTCSCRRS